MKPASAAAAIACVLLAFTPARQAGAQNGGVDVLFWISSYQSSTYSAHILIANRSSIDINGWRLDFELDAPVSFVNYALWTQDGNHVKLEGTGWTKIIPAGDSVWFNLAIGWENEVHVPRNVLFNSVPVELVTNFDDPDDDDEDGGGDDGDGDDGDDGGVGTPGEVEVNFRYSSVWENGYVGWFSIKNRGSVPIKGWAFAFTYPHRITLIWNGVLTVDGRRHTVRDAGWNRSIAPGDSAWFGFQGEYAGVLREPSRCLFNGEGCSLNGVLNQESQLSTAIENPGIEGFTLDVFPNPDPQSVRFSVEKGQHVTIEMIDLTGRIVDRLFEGTVPPGAVETVAIRRRDIASGPYVVRLSGGAGTQAHRTVVLVR